MIITVGAFPGHGAPGALAVGTDGDFTARGVPGITRGFTAVLVLATLTTVGVGATTAGAGEMSAGAGDIQITAGAGVTTAGAGDTLITAGDMLIIITALTEAGADITTMPSQQPVIGAALI